MEKILRSIAVEPRALRGQGNIGPFPKQNNENLNEFDILQYTISLLNSQSENPCQIELPCRGGWTDPASRV